MQEIKIAIISDIHGNRLALEKVLEDIQNRGIQQIYCLGDLVDFAPWGNQVISMIRQQGIPCILGNHDERIAFDLAIRPLVHHDQVETENRILAINHSKQTIIPSHKAWLANLPYQLELTYNLKNRFYRVLLVHASLRSNDEYIYQQNIPEDMIKTLKNRNIDALFMGHTHQAYVQSLDEVLLVNAGSVGRSREVDRLASYSILTMTTEKISAEIIKLAYPIEQVAEAIYQSDIPDFYADFLLMKV